MKHSEQLVNKETINLINNTCSVALQQDNMKEVEEIETKYI